jgi:hypothetical protein
MVINEGSNAEIIVISASVVGESLGLISSWFTASAILSTIIVLSSFLLLRSTPEQILNNRDYSKSKKMIDKMLDDD